jgi:hypothetical protein
VRVFCGGLGLVLRIDGRCRVSGAILDAFSV